MKPTQYYFNENNLLHRENGPAVIHYFTNGEASRTEYWLNGKPYDRIEYIVIMLNELLAPHGYNIYFDKPHYVIDKDGSYLIRCGWWNLEETISNLQYD